MSWKFQMYHYLFSSSFILITGCTCSPGPQLVFSILYIFTALCDYHLAEYDIGNYQNYWKYQSTTNSTDVWTRKKIELNEPSVWIRIARFIYATAASHRDALPFFFYWQQFLTSLVRNYNCIDINFKILVYDPIIILLSISYKVYPEL